MLFNRVFNIPVPEFTLPQIETIFDSMSQGASYNEKGMPAAPGDRIMTVGDLLRSKLDRKGLENSRN